MNEHLRSVPDAPLLTAGPTILDAMPTPTPQTGANTYFLHQYAFTQDATLFGFQFHVVTPGTLLLLVRLSPTRFVLRKFKETVTPRERTDDCVWKKM